MPLSIAESKNKSKVFNEIKTKWDKQTASNNWTEANFKFIPPKTDWLLGLKTLSKLTVEVKWNAGFKVTLFGTAEDGGQTKCIVGELPGTG